MLRAQHLSFNEQLYFYLTGPDMEAGAFKSISIKSIHYKRLPVTHVVAGQTAALAIKKIKKSQVGSARQQNSGL